MNHIVTLAAGLTALLFATPAASAKGAKGHAKHPAAKAGKHLFAKFDTNKDKALSKDEITAMPDKLEAKVLKRDKDGDGTVTRKELAKHAKGKKHQAKKSHGKKRHKKG